MFFTDNTKFLTAQFNFGSAFERVSWDKEMNLFIL